MPSPNYLSAKSFSYCRSVTRKFGTSYFLATSLFPSKIRKPTWVLYAFLRTIDEIVDNQIKDGVEAGNAIKQASSLYQNSKININQDSVLGMMAIVSNKFDFKDEWVQKFFDAMYMDTFINRYQNYSELENYMEGSASVVGYMMSSIIGYKKDALVYAQSLGQAMQLTNFLRDIKEDFEKGRIYIPQDWLARFGVNEDHFKLETVDENWVNLMKHAVDLNFSLYKKAEKGIPLLDRAGQRQVYASLLLYRQILRQIEKQNYDIFYKRASVPKTKKILLIIKAFCYTKKYE